MFCNVVTISIPSGVVYLETTTGTLITVHLETNAPMTKNPKIDAPSVIFCSLFPFKSLTTKSKPFL